MSLIPGTTIFCMTSIALFLVTTSTTMQSMTFVTVKCELSQWSLQGNIKGRNKEVPQCYISSNTNEKSLSFRMWHAFSSHLGYFPSRSTSDSSGPRRGKFEGLCVHNIKFMSDKIVTYIPLLSKTEVQTIETHFLRNMGTEFQDANSTGPESFCFPQVSWLVASFHVLSKSSFPKRIPITLD